MTSVLIVVFDGLQPSQVTPELMPNLSALAAEGVTFGNHHPVFPTVTRTNAASMVTGRSPGGHGLAANTLVVRDFQLHHAISAMEPELSRVAAKTGRTLLSPTLADILSTHGQEYVAIGVGTSGNAYVHNPEAERSGGATIHPDFTLPRSLNGEIIERFGAWPPEGRPNTAKMAHAVRILTEYILPERDPSVALIWSSEPDKSQHAQGVGSELANAALSAADEQLGVILRWLAEAGREAGTDVMVVSDHGYSTISEVVDLNATVGAAGFPSGDRPGGVIVAANGGFAMLYVRDKDAVTADHLANFLMRQPWCGALLASEAVAGIPGTLPLSLAGGEGPRAPELAMSFRWDSRPNGARYPGHAPSTGGAPGLGQHGSMSRHELRNILFARGPSFRQALKVEAPSGNTDLAPTILRILGLGFQSGAPMDGRVLEEALASESVPEPQHVTETHEAERPLEDGRVFRQAVTVSRVGTTTYVDQGNTLGS